MNTKEQKARAGSGEPFLGRPSFPEARANGTRYGPVIVFVIIVVACALGFGLELFEAWTRGG